MTAGHADVLVVGGGPAGRAVAGRCAARGLRTTLVDPAPERPWRATYGAWADELPGGLPPNVVGSRARARAFATGPHDLGRCYVVLDTAALRRHLDDHLAGVRVVAAAVEEVRDGRPYTVQLAGGTEMTADVVVDAAGAPGSLRPAPRSPAEQTAYGLVVPDAVAAPLVAPGEALFMDWRPDHGRSAADGWPTFLYAVPYGDGTVLLEETSLARRPGLGAAELRTRLHARLRRHGVDPAPDARVEKVRFPVDSPRGPLHPIPFGAATPLVHPASGFSVATALSLAPAVADAIVAGPGRAPAAARRVLWSPAARTVHLLRRQGLRTVLDMPPDLVPAFFEAFFRLPHHRSRAFLSGRDDVVGTLAAMSGLFRHTDPGIRVRLLRSAVRPAISAVRRSNG